MTKKYVRYICNRIIFTVIIWLCVFGNGATATNTINEYGVYSSTSDHFYKWSNGSHNCEADIYMSCNMNMKYDRRMRVGTQSFNGGTHDGLCNPTPPNDGQWYNYLLEDSMSNKQGIHNQMIAGTGFWQCSGSGSYQKQWARSVVVFYGQNDNFTLSGNTCGLSYVNLYIHDGSSWFKINNDSLTLTGDSYNFNIVNNTQYKIEFSDTHEYEFTCTNNVIYNRDLCSYQIIHYVDDCANFLKNPCINIIVNDNYANPLIEDGTSHTDVFMIGTDVQLNDKLDIWIGTDQGEQFRTIYVKNSEDYLYHSYKSWDLDVKVYDINTTNFISNAKVSINQGCRINGYDLHTYGFTNLYGYVKTYDLSNQPYHVKVIKEGYNTFGYTAVNAGFDAQHTNIPLSIYIQDSTKGTGNGSIGEPPNGGEGGGGGTVLPQTECSILWTDNNTKSITEINNTQGARLYFMAPNCSATLYIESRNINTHTWDIETYIGLSPLQTGYSQVVPSDWIYPKTKRYRGRLYAYDCGCDATDYLKVWHTNDPNITVIANLSANVMFRHKIGGSYINPSSPIHILSSASSNNTSLLNINLQLFNESVKVDEISYTVFDYYNSGSFNPIKWEPNYGFTAGYNYCIYMYSNDILVDFDTVFANATGDNPFDTGNALTVKVYDHNSLPLQYSTVYVESWGSLDTGATNEITFNGLGCDTYEYRALKCGYIDRGFDSVTLSADATVSYILDIIDTEHVVRDIRMADTDIKAMLYPIVFFILIMLLVGVLIDAVS